MKNLKGKILETIISVILLFIVLNIAFGFFISLINMDDDLMFIYGFTLMAITCLVVMLGIISFWLTSIWHNKKQINRRKKNDCSSSKGR